MKPGELDVPGRDERSLGFGSLLALGVNGIVGVGIFLVPSTVAAHVPGTAGVWVYVVVAIALTPVAWTYATLGGRFEEDGGPYVWARAAFGPLVAFGVGWIAYVSALFSTSAVVAGLAEHAAPGLGLSGAGAVRAFATVCILCVAGTVAVGLRPSAMVWNAVTVLKLVPLVLLSVLALAGAGRAAQSAVPGDAVGVGRAALVVVFAMQGFEIVPVPAGNARAARRAVPAATLGSLLGAATLYVILHWACVHALPDLPRHAAPLVDAAAVYGGERAGWLVGVGTNVSALGIVFGMFAMTPRYLAALGRADGLGSWVGSESKQHVPTRALVLTTCVVLACVLTGRLDELFELSSVAVLAQYAMCAAALLVLSITRRNGLDRRHVWPAPLALGAILMIAWSARAVELLVAGGMLVAGGVLLLLRRLRDRS